MIDFIWEDQNGFSSRWGDVEGGEEEEKEEGFFTSPVMEWRETLI